MRIFTLYHGGPLETRDLQIGNFRSNRITNRIESAATIRIRIESGIESGCSRLRVQCRLPQELCSCSTTAYYR